MCAEKTNAIRTATAHPCWRHKTHGPPAMSGRVARYREGVGGVGTQRITAPPKTHRLPTNKQTGEKTNKRIQHLNRTNMMTIILTGVDRVKTNFKTKKNDNKRNETNIEKKMIHVIMKRDREKKRCSPMS